MATKQPRELTDLRNNIVRQVERKLMLVRTSAKRRPRIAA